MTIGIENYWLFLITGLLLNITPGNDTIYILTRSISQGKQAGIASVLGISSGSIIHTFLVAYGLTTILNNSIVLFNIIKYTGVVYLIFIGVKMIIEKDSIIAMEAENKTLHLPYRIYLQGVLTNLLNPKVALFFMSFLPQFINVYATNSSKPFFVLGLTFVTTGTVWCLILVFLASLVTKQLKMNSTWIKRVQKISGSIIVGLGIKLAIPE